MSQGAWIFLSHSNKDFEKVREIRNELEKRGHKPIMFYLKCLENDNAMLPDLLRREIAAREFFILCDSPNAQASQYVRDEVELIKSMEGKAFEVVDLSRDLPSEFYKLVQLSKRATVFLSYARSDSVIVSKIGEVLRKRDYKVWTDAEIRPGEEWAEGIAKAINESVQQGFVILLLSQASLKSKHCRAETLYALKLAASSGKSNVVPVIIEQFDYTSLPLELQAIQYFDLTTGPFDGRMEELICNLKTREME